MPPPPIEKKGVQVFTPRSNFYVDKIGLITMQFYRSIKYVNVFKSNFPLGSLRVGMGEHCQAH